MRKLFAALLFSSLSLSAAAVPAPDGLFQNWKNDALNPNNANIPLPPPSDVTWDYSFSAGYVADGSFSLQVGFLGSYTKDLLVLSAASIGANGVLGQPQQLLGTTDGFSKNPVPLGYAPGTEFVFILENKTTGQTYYSNSPGSAVSLHNYINTGHTLTLVGFDVGGNNTYDGFLFQISGSKTIPTATLAVPEPETYAMLLAGLGIVGAVARRQTMKKD